MNLVFWLNLILILLPIVLLIRVAFLKIELSSLHWLGIGLMLIPIFGSVGLARYALIASPPFRKELGETLSWFLENWYFVYFDVVIIIGFIILFLYKKR